MACEAEKAVVNDYQDEYEACVEASIMACEADPFNPTTYQATINAVQNKHVELVAAIETYKNCLNNSGGGSGGSGSPPT